MQETQSLHSWAVQEMQHTKLPDKRYVKNLTQMFIRLASNTGQSFSSACGPALRKSAHRLFSEDDLDIQSGHIAETGLRCKAQNRILVLEDTTDISYPGRKQTEGLGNLGGRKPIAGICAHTALAVSMDREPLGLLGQHIWAPVNENRKSALLRKLSIEQKESYKWLRTVQWVNQHLLTYDGQVVIVGDREGDFYEHFSAPRNKKVDLVVRLLHKQRNVQWENEKKIHVSDLLSKLSRTGEREITLPARKGQKERKAALSIYYTSVICPGRKGHKEPDIPLNIIWAVEENPPDGIDPLEWIIMTTLPVNSFEQAIEIIDIYAMRWIVERFFYVLKQGLRIERLQFDNFTRLSNAIKLCSIVAWYLIRIAYLSKSNEHDSADKHFDAVEKVILEKVTNKKIETVRDYILTLGKLVGFVPSKKQPYPGEKLLWQAIQQMNAMKAGFLLSQNYGTG
jgi:hypothetical protein